MKATIRTVKPGEILPGKYGSVHGAELFLGIYDRDGRRWFRATRCPDRLFDQLHEKLGGAIGDTPATLAVFCPSDVNPYRTILETPDEVMVALAAGLMDEVKLDVEPAPDTDVWPYRGPRSPRVRERHHVRGWQSRRARTRKMKETLKRTGDASLSFEGDLVAEVSGQIHAGKEQNRWHDLVLYRTGDERYYLGIAYRTNWEGELERYEIHGPDSIKGIRSTIRMYNPIQHVMGFPPGQQFEARQRRLEMDIRYRFEERASELFEAAGIVEEA